MRAELLQGGTASHVCLSWPEIGPSVTGSPTQINQFSSIYVPTRV